MKQVITYQSPSGTAINICPTCASLLQTWPKDTTGQEYCTVVHGLHNGVCDIWINQTWMTTIRAKWTSTNRITKNGKTNHF